MTLPFSYFDAIGIIGVCFILLAYLALQTERIDPLSKAYSTINALGALLIIISLLYDFNLSAFLMELSWLLISVFGLLKAFKSR